MYTQCPECRSVFSLDAQTLAEAHGQVVCGYCQAAFDSLATLGEQLPPEPFTELPPNELASAPPRLDLVVYRPRPEPSAVSPPADAVTAAAPATEDFSQLVFAPRFARQPASHKSARSERRRHRRAATERRWPWVVACLLLALLLGVQVVWAKRDVIIRDPVAGSWLRHTCTALHCTLPLVAAPDRLHLTASNVQKHPGTAGALMISAKVRNDAAFAQPYPVLTLTLSDAHGQRLAMRRLQPREYLDDTAVLQRGLAPGASTVLLLEVADPGEQATAFEFGFE
jgi:predicted Zn finger-like uncharacterized protein